MNPVRSFKEAIKLAIKLTMQAQFLRLAAVLLVSVLPALASATSQPFAKGTSGSLNWQLRFTHLDPMGERQTPVCRDHESQTWCRASDRKSAEQKAGVFAHLQDLLADRQFRSYALTSLSFSNSKMATQLCNAAKSRDNINISIYVDSANFSDSRPVANSQAERLFNCHPNLKIYPRGKSPYGSRGAHLQHMKIFVASPQREIVPLAELSDSEAKSIRGTRTVVTSSSANMSSYGTSLHYENWMFLEDETESHHIQANLCAIRSLHAAAGSARRAFVKSYSDCLKSIEMPARRDLQFFAVPHGRKSPQPFEVLKREIERAQSEVYLAIHRLTTSKVGDVLAAAAKSRRAIDVSIIYDDDTLLSANYGSVDKDKLTTNFTDVRVYRNLIEAGVETRFVQTNHNIRHLMHNKFAVIDGRVVFQGAGNFTATALNIGSRYGNYEQFYIIRIPALAEAYRAAWWRLYEMATTAENHPLVSSN